MGESGEINTDETTLGKKVNRRQVLAMIGGVVAATPFALAQAERGLVHIFADGLTNHELVDGAIDTIKQQTEKKVEKENPDFRPLQQIIQEGIDRYSQDGQKPVSYTRSKDYQDITYYADVLKEISDKVILPQSPAYFKAELKKKLYGEAGSAYLESWNDNNQFEDLFPTGSGLYARFLDKNPGIVDANGHPVNFDDYFPKLSDEGKTAMNDIRSHIEDLVTKTGAPVSSAHILKSFLDRNQGNVEQSLVDTSITLKFMARNDPETGLYSARQHPEQNNKWFAAHIKDEFKGPSYHTATDTVEQINLIGKPYHSFNLVSLLQFVPVELIQGATAFEYMNYGSGHGASKADSDLQTLSDLRAIETNLLQYATDSSQYP